MKPRNFCAYLVSDSTGETVTTISRSVFSHFSHIFVEEHVWSFVQTHGKIEKLARAMYKKPGILIYTTADEKLSTSLEKICRDMNVLCINALSSIVNKIAHHLDLKMQPIIGKQHQLDESYFAKIEAINFTLMHDDGQSISTIHHADVILIGVSRTSKSPTCLYLAQRGLKAANIPFVKGIMLPEIIFQNVKPLIVGLTTKAIDLVSIRRNRILHYEKKLNDKYVDIYNIQEELDSAKKIYNHYNWPVIDVSRRSVEETSAIILQLHDKKQIKESIKTI